MLVSFVILTYQRGELLQRCLDSIYKQEGFERPFELILIDNGGDARFTPPGDPAIHFRLERPMENLGPARSRNLGMALAGGKYQISLDDDAEWQRPDAVARLVAHMQADPLVAAVSARSVDPQGNLIRLDLPHPDKAFISRVTRPVEIPYFYTVGLALRSEVATQVGGFPERFFYGMDEPDLSLRIIDAGYKLLYDPSVVVTHHRSDLGRPVRGMRYWRDSAVNKTRMAVRNLPFPYPVTTCLVWSAAALVKTRDLRCIMEIWRTLWTERGLLRCERKPIQHDALRYLRQIGARLWY